MHLCPPACECEQVYAFFLVCMKCAGVWVGAGLCKYWCIAVRKAITNSGPGASLYQVRERGGGVRHIESCAESSYKWLTQSQKSTDTRISEHVDECRWDGRVKTDGKLFTMRTHADVQQHSNGNLRRCHQASVWCSSILFLIYRRVIRPDRST